MFGKDLIVVEFDGKKRMQDIIDSSAFPSG
jgi:glutamine synthetase type III